MREVLIHDHTLDEKRVLQGTADLPINLDQLEIDILALEVGDGENGIDGDLGELVMRLGNTVPMLGPRKRLPSK